MALVLTWLASTLSASRPAIELPRARIRSTKDLRRSRLPELVILHLFLHSAPTGKRNFLLPPLFAAPRMRSILFVFWTTMANFDEVSQDREQKKVATSLLCDKLHTQDFAGPISLRASTVSGPDSLLGFCASFATCYARLRDFTLRVMNKRVELDVRMNPTLSLSLIMMSVLSCTICLCPFGDRLLCFHGETIFSVT